MNGKEQRRAMILTAVVEGRLNAPEAATLMRLSGRQERRLRQMFLREVARKRGVPLALYSDRHKIFQSEAKEPLTPEEELAGKPLPTQVRCVLDELGITWIGARSPQAKGRVERLWRTFQDRLYQELRLAGVTTLEQANAALPNLLKRHNARFRRPPAERGSAYRRLPAGRRPNDVFCFRYWRTVSNDNVVSLEGRLIPIPPGPGRRSYARCRVEVREHLDGSATVHYHGARIARHPPQPGDLRTKHRGKPGEKPPPALTATNNAPKPPPTGPSKPSADHPWRRPLVKAQRTFSQTT